jgi:hypothetical protein
VSRHNSASFIYFFASLVVFAPKIVVAFLPSLMSSLYFYHCQGCCHNCCCFCIVTPVAIVTAVAVAATPSVAVALLLVWQLIVLFVLQLDFDGKEKRGQFMSEC